MFRAARSVALAAALIVLAGAAPVASSAADAAEEETLPPPSLADQLADAAQAGASGAEELADAVGLPATGPGSLQVDDDGRASATVTFATRPSAEQIDAVGQLARVDRVYRLSPSVAVAVPPAQLSALAALPGVVAVALDLRAAVGTSSSSAAARPATAAAESCRSVPVDADEPLKTALARDAFDVDGSGVTIGILSDSYATSATATTTPAEDVSAGVLPGPGNPCGYDTPVEVLADHPGGSDEGRGMAQIVHGIAPGARILFASGFGGMIDMAENILALADAGADIIVDDISYVTEPHFQQGIVSAAIEMVKADGVAYYTSAGNANAVGAEGTRSKGLPIAGWQAPAYRGVTCPEWVLVPDEVVAYDCLDFDPGDGVDPVQSVGLFATPSAPTFALGWGEAQGAVASRFSLQLYSDEAVPALIAAGVTPDPQVPVEMLTVSPVPTDGEYGFVVVRDLTGDVAPPPAVWIGTFGNGTALAWREYDRDAGGDLVGAVINGHNGDGSGVSVAAAAWDYPWEPESFSSPGPGTILFEPYDPYGPPSAAYPEPMTVAAPQITGVDGERTSFFETPFDEGGEVVYRFYGTSAAAPSVAAVHALALEYAPGASPADILTTAEATAAEMSNPYWQVMPDAHVYGAGLADAHALLAALPDPTPTPEPTPTPTLEPTPGPSSSPTVAPSPAGAASQPPSAEPARLAASGSTPPLSAAFLAALLIAGGVAITWTRRTRRRRTL